MVGRGLECGGQNTRDVIEGGRFGDSGGGLGWEECVSEERIAGRGWGCRWHSLCVARSVTKKRVLAGCITRMPRVP